MLHFVIIVDILKPQVRGHQICRFRRKSTKKNTFSGQKSIILAWSGRTTPHNVPRVGPQLKFFTLKLIRGRLLIANLSEIPYINNFLCSCHIQHAPKAKRPLKQGG